MIKRCLMKELEPLIRETISLGNTFTLIPRGTSMLPLIREGSDSVILSALPDKPKKHDIVLYKRADGQYVLHRIMRVKNGVYTMCGDHHKRFEYPVTHDMLIARAIGMQRDDKNVNFDTDSKYRRYCIKNSLSKEAWNFYINVRHICADMLRKIGLKK